MAVTAATPAICNCKLPFLSLFPFLSSQNRVSASTLRRPLHSLNALPNLNATNVTGLPETIFSGIAAGEPRKGSDVLVEALEREGVTNVFAFPGGATLEIHVALLRSSIRAIVPRHEQGGVFAAEGYARASGFPGVCIATSGPGATNFITGLADALFDSIPMVAITGQVPSRLMGTGVFQDTPIVEVTKSITKKNYLVLDAKHIPRIVREAFYVASSGRPGPVLIDIPKDIQLQLVVPKWDQPMRLPNYISSLPTPPPKTQLKHIIKLISKSEKPVLYVGGGCLNSSEELREFVELTGIPVASTLMGLGAYPCSDDLSLQMLGIHGTVYANYAVDRCDLLLAFGVRFDDHVTGKLKAFATRAKIVHIDIDPDEIGKNKQPFISVFADIKLALQGLNEILLGSLTKSEFDFSAWREDLKEQERKNPLTYETFGDEVPPQHAIQVLNELTNGNAIISTGVGQHQMWAAQFYKHDKPRQWLTSGGFGAMGFGLPAAIGASIARPDAVVVNIDGDGSFMMNCQELATARVENLRVKTMILNNQHLGLNVQHENIFYGGVRLHSYLGNPTTKMEIFPDMLKFAEACAIPAARVTKKGDLTNAIQKMLDAPGPYLLDVLVPHDARVMPMIPPDGAFKDTIVEDKRRSVC